MNKSLMKGIFLSIVLFSSMVLVTIPNVYAQEINVKSFALEETSILKVTNELDKEVNTIRIWLDPGLNFQSFKTEEGWSGEQLPQGVIVFTSSSETIKPNESVKFGIKTDKAEPAINWRALDREDIQLNIGRVLPEKLSKIVDITPPPPPLPPIDIPPPPPENNPPPEIGPAMTSASTFRIIPEKPNVGSSIRVTGEEFGASQKFDFYIDSKKIGSFETDKDGHFMTTMEIPENQNADRVDFKVRDKDGEEKIVSLRIEEPGSRSVIVKDIKLTIQGIPSVIHRGDLLEISGTGESNSAITVEVTNPDGEIVNSRTAKINADGNWALESITVPLNAKLGEYSATITDGKNTIQKSWNIESDKTIFITPTSLKFEAGETMIFNGTAMPNQSIEVSLEDPLGQEIFSDIIQLDESGSLEFEFPTSQSITEGTYTLIATQGTEKELIFVGIGQLPVIPISLEFDKLNYKASEKVIISLTGKESDIVSLLIINPSDVPIGNATSITLQSDGKGTYSLDLAGYTPGIYSAIVSKGSAQSTKSFTVGLNIGSEIIYAITTKTEYLPGDSILILGNTGPDKQDKTREGKGNVLLTITLIDPDGNIVKTKETFSDKKKMISEKSFRVPSDAKPGTWVINVRSGSTFDNAEITVLSTVKDGMVLTVTDGQDIPGFGHTINIVMFGAPQVEKIEIIAEDGDIIAKLNPKPTAQGEVNLPWQFPADTAPGVYTIRATDAFDETVEITHELQ